MTQHTRGPWISGFSPRRVHKHYVRKNYDHDTCETDIAYVKTGKEDAALIAAAPDLYDVAVAARKHLCDENPRADDLLPLLNALNAAIAKATVQS